MTPSEKDRVLELTRRYVAPHRVDVWDAFGTQLVIGRREGYRLWDLDGRELVDLHLNGGTFNLGHRHPDVVEAMVTAASTLDVGNHHFASLARAELAERLAELTPGELTYTVFASGGSEAIDVAIKTARRATGRRRIVTLAAGYHGRTGLSGAAGEDGGAAYFLSDMPEDFAKVPFGDPDAIEAELARGDVAAVLLETVPATYGFPVPPDGYLPAVKALCEEHDALYIADEVQTGLGRTGRLWGVETFGVEPDILVSGKGLSGGMYPIAATVMTPRAAGWLHENGWGHVSTFGGAEIGCRVAERVLEITTRPDVTERVRHLIGLVGRGLARASRASALPGRGQTERARDRAPRRPPRRRDLPPAGTLRARGVGDRVRVRPVGPAVQAGAAARGRTRHERARAARDGPRARA